MFYYYYYYYYYFLSFICKKALKINKSNQLIDRRSKWVEGQLFLQYGVEENGVALTR